MTSLTDRVGAEPDGRPSSDLSRLLHPVSLPTFRDEYWERRPLHIPRNDPERFADLLTLDDVDRVLGQSGPDFGNVRVIREGEETPVSELGAPGRNMTASRLEALYERYRSGSTVILNALERRWEPLARFTSMLSAEVNARFQVNVYLTPGGQARGFDPHYDSHDVIVMQAYGSKRWRLYGAPYALPLEGQRYDHSGEVPEVEEEFDLQPGSLLYLPRGTIHAATSNDAASMHLTFGVHPVLIPALISDAVREVFEGDERFRRSMPLGFANDKHLQEQAEDVFAELIDALAARLSPQEMTARAVKQTTSLAPVTLRGHLGDLESLPRLDLDTRVRRRPGLRWSVALGEEVIELEFHSKTIQLPVHVADEVRFVTESDGQGFTAGSIPGGLDQPGCLLLVRTLVREGFLTLS
ncbi:cupin domain-containing protein [Kitasatospora sp. NPDC127121]|uniref:cupin domain-containing protein n=1 Tax=Kitasatospora sp. NPDC127121 TaxID=3345371 RepID=UPI00362D7527